MLRVLILFVIVFSQSTLAWSATTRLSADDIARIKAYKMAVSDVEKKTVVELIQEIEKSHYPQVAITLKETMAKAYEDIVKEQRVVGVKKKEWLYSMINLNMAYLQFAGLKGSTKNTDPLNKLIRYKLKTYLPETIINQPGFHISIE